MLVTFPSPILELQHAPLPPQSAISQGACPDSLLFHCFQFGFTFESMKELRGVSLDVYNISKKLELVHAHNEASTVRPPSCLRP
jgi:hypothetical protein